MNLLRILKELVEEEYECFLHDCYINEEDSDDYSSSADWLLNGIVNLWKAGVMDCHGFSRLDENEMMEKYGDLILFQYPEFLHYAKPINRLVKLRTLLNYNLRY